MTSFKCRECDSHWMDGPTRDHNATQLCRECLVHKLKVCHADAKRGLNAESHDGRVTALQCVESLTREALAHHN